MFRSVLASRWLRADPQRPGEQHRHGARGITGAVCAAVAAGIAFTTAGLAGAAVPAAAATRSLGPPEYSSAWVGYQAGGRWFRYVSTTVTVPPQVVAPSPGAPSQRGDATIWLYGIGSVVPTEITVAPGGGPVSWGDPGGSGTFRISPRIGDRLTLSIYYDQHGHVYLTATDLTRHTTQTVRTNVPKMTYLHARLFAWVYNDATPPVADTPLWQFTDSRVTTYRGDHGTIVGPWTTSQTIVSTASTASGTVIASPSGLSNGGQDFTAWFRALPLAYTDGLAGYEASGGRWFRFVSTTLTVPAATQPASAGDFAAIWLGQHGATPRAYATITVLPGGGAGSVSYTASYGPRSNAGTFAISPRPGDRLAVSVYYDRLGHDYFTASDLTQAVARTARVNADLAGTAYTTAGIGGEISNSAVTPTPADTRLWDFSSSHVTTYSGDKGTTLGPWATSEIVDTIGASTPGAVVMSPSVLSNGGQDFGVWLRHQ
jgi:hypothetical protein